MEIKNCLYKTGKILYKIVEVPFNILVGNYDPRNQKLIKQKEELKKQIKSLDSQLAEIKLKNENLDKILQYTLKDINKFKPATK